jgi:cation transport ATPase
MVETVAWSKSVAAVSEVRWAAASTILFGLAALLQVTGSLNWLIGVCYVGCYLAGGWQPARAGVQALGRKSLDVDLLMVVAAVAAAAWVSSSMADC